MGKESRLRSGYKPGETRQQYTNGDRKFYDSNAVPAGADEYVWSLALYFEQKLEAYDGKAMTPVTYTKLYEKISRDKDLTRLLEPGTMYISGKGEGGKPVTGSDIHSFIIRMIDYFFYNYESDSIPTIELFISNFTDIKVILLHIDYLKRLKSTGIPVVREVPQPDRREEKVREVLDITVNRVYTEQDMKEMFTNWRDGNN